jgi:dinuclear metal center YbgI/SA1388 family protein
LHSAHSLLGYSSWHFLLFLKIVSRADELLKPHEFSDWPGAVNGLQVENRGKVSKIAAAVDGTLATIKLAIEAKADLLLVHHGLFWSPTHPWTGNKYLMLRLLLDHDLAVYSSHLPLDAHPRLGNNAQICAALGFTKLKPFYFEKGKHIGLQTRTKIHRHELVQRMAAATNSPVNLAPGGPDICRKIGVVTGGAGDQLKKAHDEGVDTFITGEGPHWSFAVAEDLGMNVLYGGHYATETFGVKALANVLSKEFTIPWAFLDHPSGL